MNAKKHITIETTLLIYFEDIYSAINQHVAQQTQTLQLILQDLSSVFNSINRLFLLKRLHSTALK